MLRRSLVVLLSFTALSCATADPDARRERERYTGVAGTLAVGAIPDIRIRDESRAKDITLTIEYPMSGGAHPLILFSHGYGGSNQSYAGLTSYWASHGYVVIKPAHADTLPPGAVQTLADAWNSQTPADWQNRVRDLSFILDSLDELTRRYPELQGKIDRARIGAGGHSYGAHTALLIGGVRTMPGPTSYADPRVRAVVAMSPQGPSELRGLTPDSFAELRVPTLFMTGTHDVGVSEEETPQWRRQAFELAPPGDKWLVVLQGARHGSFTGRLDDVLEDRVAERQRDDRAAALPTRRGTVQTIDPAESRVVVRERDIFTNVRTLSLAFWDAYLRGDADARAALTASRRGVQVEQR